MDATPIRVGQVFGGYASQIEHAVQRVDRAVSALTELAVGGTAVGTGINTHTEFGRRVASELAQKTGIPFREADQSSGSSSGEGWVRIEASGQLKSGCGESLQDRQ